MPDDVRNLTKANLFDAEDSTKLSEIQAEMNETAHAADGAVSGSKTEDILAKFGVTFSYGNEAKPAEDHKVCM